MRLAIISTHPIQYNAPWFRMLAQSGNITIKVFYTWEQSKQGQNFDPGFGKVIAWDIPLVSGYDHVFVKNTSEDPGTHAFKGIVNPGLEQDILEWKAEAILVFGWSHDSHLTCLRRFHGKIPVLFRGDSTLLDEQPGLKKMIRRIFLKWVYRHIDTALYVGANNKAYFKAHGLKEKQLVFAPHAIDNDRFLDSDGTYSRRAAEWRQQLGFEEQDVVVLFAGKLEAKKDPGVLLKIAREVKDKRLKFLLVGNGNLEKSLKEEAANLENVKFLDFQNQQNMPVVYRLGDVFVLPSVGPGETWGLAINEAMASGLPVLASDKVGGAVDLIRQGQNGYIFPHGDVNKLHEQLLAVAVNPSGMGRKSEEIIRSWSFTAIISAIQSVLN